LGQSGGVRLLLCFYHLSSPGPTVTHSSSLSGALCFAQITYTHYSGQTTPFLHFLISTGTPLLWSDHLHSLGVTAVFSAISGTYSCTSLFCSNHLHSPHPLIMHFHSLEHTTGVLLPTMVRPAALFWSDYILHIYIYTLW